MESIMRNAANRYNRFKIRVALGSKNAMPQEIPVSVTRSAQPQVAGIGAVPGVYGYGQSADIGAIEKRLEEKYKNELKAELEKRELVARIEGLEYSLKERRKKNGDWTAKLESFAEVTGLNLENPQSIQAISGLVMGIMDKVLGAFKTGTQPVPALAGTRPRPGTTDVRHVPAEDGTEAEPDQPDTVEGQELTEDDYRALDALDILKAAGAADPAGIMEKVAKFYQSNPAMAEGFINQYLPA
jgi:hypothetical protein